MNVKALLLLAAGCLAVSAAVADDEARTEPGHRHHEMPAFADVDADSDGMISADELAAVHAKHMAERAKEGRKMKNAGKACAFENIDTDADGKVSPEEFAAHHAEMMERHRRHRQAQEESQ